MSYNPTDQESAALPEIAKLQKIADEAYSEMNEVIDDAVGINSSISGLSAERQCSYF